MKHEMPLQGRQFKSCPKCSGQMEFRLGIWDCGNCGHSEADAKGPADDLELDPAHSVKRAKLIVRPEISTTGRETFDEPGRIYSRKQLNSDPLGTRLMCLGLQILLAVLSHGYIFIHGNVDTWIDTDYVLGRAAIQLVYVFLIGVALIWREAPPKYVALVLSLLVFTALLMQTMMEYRLVPQLNWTNGPFFPEIDPWYWAVLLAIHTVLILWIGAIILRDLGARNRASEDRLIS